MSFFLASYWLVFSLYSSSEFFSFGYVVITVDHVSTGMYMRINLGQLIFFIGLWNDTLLWLNQCL